MAIDVTSKEDVVTEDGRVFYHLGEIPYTRKSNGTEAVLFVWHSECAKCGAPFTITTPAAGRTKAFYQRHCQEHKGGWPHG